MEGERTERRTLIDEEIVSMRKDTILAEKERHEEYTVMLKDYIGHLKEEINIKNDEIAYKNELFKNYNLVYNKVQEEKSRMETMSQSSFSSVIAKSDTCATNHPSVVSKNVNDYAHNGSKNDHQRTLITPDYPIYENIEKDDLHPTTNWITYRRKRKARIENSNNNHSVMWVPP